MNRLVQCSTLVYEWLLFLYPKELREDFGDEMVLAFADDLEQAWGDARVAGVLQIWWYALYELAMVALPSQWSSRYIVVPASSFFACACSQTMFMVIGAHQEHADAAAALAAQWPLPLAIGLLNGFVALIVTCLSARCSMTLLRLD